MFEALSASLRQSTRSLIAVAWFSVSPSACGTSKSPFHGQASISLHQIRNDFELSATLLPKAFSKLEAVSMLSISFTSLLYKGNADSELAKMVLNVVAGDKSRNPSSTSKDGLLLRRLGGRGEDLD